MHKVELNYVAMTNKIWGLSGKLIASGLFGLSWIAPALAQPNERVDIPRIYQTRRYENIEIDVRLYKKRKWSQVSPKYDFLENENWLLTAENSQADMLLVSEDVLYWQGENSFSQFVRQQGCQFHVEFGKTINAHPGESPKEGCDMITGEVEIELPGTSVYVFRNQEAQETIVAVLTHSSKEPVRVTNRKKRDEIVELGAGQFVVVTADGKLRRGEFSLRYFYENERLALGLGCGGKHKQYASQQPTEVQPLISNLQQEACEALRSQPQEPEDGGPLPPPFPPPGPDPEC